jgi:formylglycine-generating enzyme required for sulfatase activity
LDIGHSIKERIPPMRTRKKTLAWLLLTVLPWTAVLAVRARQTPSPGDAHEVLPLETRAGMIRIPAGSFLMGSPHPGDEDQQPVHRVEIDAFWLDATPVTNAQFAEFVRAEQYVTTAERLGKSLVFDRQSAAWQEAAGADWQHPEGPESSIAGKDDWPVVQVSWYDATAYAAWRGKRLPSEAEFEYAARGGLADADFPWGRQLAPRAELKANYWQGTFPEENLLLDGYSGPSPVEKFPPNRFALHDMAGNVWQWCGDWYDPEYYGKSLGPNPTGPREGAHRVRRGGSWMSPASADHSLRVYHRDYAPPREAANHMGFRCASDAPPVVVN